MGKFRRHTLDEKRKLRNARQKRKREQKAIERRMKQDELAKKELEIKVSADYHKGKAQEYYRKWNGKCLENLKLRECLTKNSNRTTVRFAVLTYRICVSIKL